MQRIKLGRIIKPRTVAISAVLAALYVGITTINYPFAFLGVQIRVSDALYPLIGLLGWPAVIGLTIGQLLANTVSPLGALDLLSPFVFFPAKCLISKFGFKAVPLHVLCVALWVPVMLTLVLHLPYLVNVASVGFGEVIAELVIGGLLYRSLKGRI